MSLGSIPRLFGAGMFALAAMAAPASAQGTAPPLFTTAELARACGPSEGDANALASRSVCYAVLVTVGQAHAMYTTGPRAAPPAFCMPNPSPSLEQVASGFVAWVAANQQHAGTRAVEGALRYAAATYPCPRPAARRR
ncbi:Rap1a/Tai family immunity protein [Roseomonas rubea]|uniref:Rap1a/Tai family immunity protein n=1 Tax=Neoroseomonas rubea TaxID=2748666 RepID=UPI0018E03B42|nr:Rap1a/Tai family immunity protein [Roseomonas rubea]